MRRIREFGMTQQEAISKDRAMDNAIIAIAAGLLEEIGEGARK